MNAEELIKGCEKKDEFGTICGRKQIDERKPNGDYVYALNHCQSCKDKAIGYAEGLKRFARYCDEIDAIEKRDELRLELKKLNEAGLI